MATLRVVEQDRSTSDPDEIRAELAAVDIRYERWLPAWSLAPQAAPEDVLAAYAEPIGRLKEEGGYAAVDVVDLTPDTAGLDGMLAQFSGEHWHDEDEVRLVVEGRGLFHLHPPSSPVLAVEVGPGDLLSVPCGTRHWFDLCGERRIRAVRLFQDPRGWTPHYTGSGIDAAHLPLCLGPPPVPTLSRVRHV
jgi:1,2-dihydroxy-3-keto-5-methylthiopentene dioxygenase